MVAIGSGGPASQLRWSGQASSHSSEEGQDEAHKDRDLGTVYQVIRRLAPPARLPTRTVRCIATGEPCPHKQHEMEEIEKGMCQIYKGTSRPLEWQAPCSSATTAVWQAPDVAELSRAIKRLPNFKAAPKIFLGDPLADTSTPMTTGSVAELYMLGVDSLAPALAGCYKVLCETGSLLQALKDGEITRLRKTKGTGENAAEDYRNISILEHCGKALVGAQLQPLMRTLQSNLDACRFGVVVLRLTLSRWQMRFFADTGSIDEGNVLPAEHVRDSSPLNLAWPWRCLTLAKHLISQCVPMRGRLLDEWLKTLRLNSSWKSCTEGFATFWRTNTLASCVNGFWRTWVLDKDQ